MIENFEEYTAVLTDHELDVLIPALTAILKTRIGAKYAIRNKDLCRLLDLRGYPGMTEARVRKCINYIRMRGLVPHLIANSNGYFVATSIAQVEKYMKSLDQRATAIWAMRSALNAQLSGKLFI